MYVCSDDDYDDDDDNDDDDYDNDTNDDDDDNNRMECSRVFICNGKRCTMCDPNSVPSY